MADSGIHAEIKKLTERVAKEIVRKHPMIANAATWHKQMQDTCRTQQQQIDLLIQRVRKMEHDVFELVGRLNALDKGKTYKPAEDKTEPEAPAVVPMTSAQIRRLRNRYQFSQDNFARLLGVSTARYGKWEKGKQPIPPDIAKQLDEIRTMKASDLRSKMISSGVLQTNGMSTRQEQAPAPNKTALVFLQSPLTGEDLKQIRTRLNMTQKKIAELLGVIVSTYATWERGRAHMPDKHTARMREISQMEPAIDAPRSSRFVPSTYTMRDLKSIRIAFSYTQAQVAERIGVKTATYQAWEQGKAHMPDKYTDAMRALEESVPPKSKESSSRQPAPFFTTQKSRISQNTPSSLGAEDLKKIREDHNFTQKLFAEKIGVCKTTYQSWELGHSRMADKYTLIVMEISKQEPEPANSSLALGHRHRSPIEAGQLKITRQGLLLSQKDMGEKFGVKEKTYQAWEQGKSHMPDIYTETAKTLFDSIPKDESGAPVFPATAKMTHRASGLFPRSAITAEELKNIRVALNLSQRLFAKEIGVNTTTYQAWECGRSRMSDQFTNTVKKMSMRKPSGQSPVTPGYSEYSSQDLKNLREALQFTQKKIASKLGVSSRTYQIWERGNSRMPNSHTAAVRALMLSVKQPGDMRQSVPVKPETVESVTKPQDTHSGPSQISSQELRMIRTTIHFTQKQMAEAIGVPVSTYTAWEVAQARMPERHTEKVRELERTGTSGICAGMKITGKNKRQAVAAIPLTPEIREEIKRCRELCGLQSDEMAMLLEKKPEIYSAWESGTADSIPQNYLERIRHLARLPEKDRQRFIVRQARKAGK